MITFEELGLSEEILNAIKELGYEKPSPIQEKSIPLLLKDHCDLVALAQTGTGKTAGFGLPLLELTNPDNKSIQSVVLSPTRELCNQIAEDLKSYSKYKRGIKILSVYGGASIGDQIRSLKQGVNVVVATPGRLKDLIERGAAKLEDIQRVVLDEADEMLNMGFKQELDFILSKTPETKSTWLFSATMPKEIERIAKKYMSNPEKITVGNQNQGAENIVHKYYMVKHSNRFSALKRIVDSNPDIFGLIFCRTKRDTQEIADRLMAEGYNVDSLHGDLSQAQRDRVMDKFREKKIQLLCATDVAARGIDVDNISHVINYELPEDTESYTHRSGRTARAGRKGESLCIVTDRESFKISRIEKMINKKFEKCEVPKGADVCKAQLFNLIEQVKATEINEEEFEKFGQEVFDQFVDIEKNKVIKLFISKAFNKFISYYQDADDINIRLNASGKREPSERREFGRDRGDRSDRPRGDRDRGDRGDRSRGDRGSSDKGGFRKDRESKSGGSSAGFKTFFINVGTADNMNTGKFIDFVCSKTEVPGKALGKIRMNDKFAFFEIESDYSDKVLDSLKRAQLDGRKLRIEAANPRE